ncbi:hypothetical protein GSI_05177 [Ganoderma sinense ZZ0214-1]|uniref:Uncharacterized protein n=1 Tax=Ganoderma sinense ZZ0214-1 TaxID=1077348 RepID=A0A2G8SFB7_9APHY|nr:hypothetical protein GSI_05177 [Ganoderma sinense ZZ0214-1]
MAGPSIIVPPAMPQRPLLPRQPHANAASKSRQGAGTIVPKGRNTNGNANAKTTPPGGGIQRKERAATRRVCSVDSCPNVLDLGWPWKRCRQCSKASKAREVRKAAIPCVSVEVACVSCYVVSEVVPSDELKAGQPYLCGRCRERNTAFPTAVMQPPTVIPKQTPAPPRNIVMHDASAPPTRDASSLGHGPPPAPQAVHSNVSIHVPMPPPPPPSRGHFVPMPVALDTNTGSGTSILDQIRRFVHPDHRHILGPPHVLVPHPPSQISPPPTSASGPVVASNPPTSATTPQEPVVKRVRLIMPHYSRTGTILAVLPEDLGMERSSLPAKVLHPPPAPESAANPENVPGSGFVSLAQIELRPSETPRKVSVTHTEDGSIKLKIPPKHTPPPIAPAPIPTPSDTLPNAQRPSEAIAAPSPSSAKKRKRPLKPASRICESPGCENVIPPRFKGSRCVQCGFARWSTLFRERFDGIRAELVQAGIAGPAPDVKQEAKTPMVKEQQSAAEERVSSIDGGEAAPSHATAPSPGLTQSTSTVKDGRGASQRTFTIPPSGLPPPVVFRKPSIKSVKLIVSPRHTEPVNTTPLDASASSSRTETPPSEAVDVPRPKIKSIKLRISIPPDSHTTAPDITAADTNDTLQPLTSPLTDLDTVEDEEEYPMDVDHDRETSDGETTDSEASIPLARRYGARRTENINIAQLAAPTAAEAEAATEHLMAMDYDEEDQDHTGDTTESEASVPLADWSPSHVPSTTPRSMSLPPIRRVRLILGPNPARTPSSSRESSPDLALSLARPFSVRRRWEALGWDTDESDLTPLEGSSDEDEGESEIDLPESSDEDEGEVGDGTGTRLSIIIPRRVEKPPEKHRWQCATVRCANILAQGSYFKNCDACRKRAQLLRKQERRRDRLEGAAPGTYDDMEYHIPPDGDLTGYRQCSRRRCSRLIPPESQYRFRTCGPCRARSRRNWWRTKGLEPPDSDPSLRKSAKASIMERAIANAVRTAAKDSVDGSATGKRKRNAVDDAQKVDAGGEKLMEMPPYQHFAALLESMRARFSQFKDVQARYVQLKALTGADSKPMVFNFDGEYSVVADPSGGSVDSVVNTVIRNVQAALELSFQPAGVHSGPEESVIASLSGEYVAKIPQLSKADFVTATTGSDAAAPSAASSTTQTELATSVSAPLEVTMAGELHICVAWDRRHKFFPGQRVMLRFRLVG